MRATGRGFPKLPYLQEAETIGLWKGADSPARLEPPYLWCGCEQMT